MTKKFLPVAVLSLAGVFAANAQELFQQWAAGVEVSTYGPGVTVATSLSPHFKVRGGLNYLSYNYKDKIDLNADMFVYSDPNRKVVETLDGNVIKPNITFLNGKVIVDYYPMENGVFSLSAGVYLGNNRVSFKGIMWGYEDPNWAFNANNAIVRPDSDGSFDGSIQFGNAVKPYFGLGLGRTIANRRVGFKFDLGLIYQGDFSVKGKNVIEGSASDAFQQEVNKHFLGIRADSDLLKLWPMLNFSLSYRIN